MPYARRMRQLAIAIVLLGGCYGSVGVGFRGPNPLALVETAVAVAAIATIVATEPPVVVDVGYYGEQRPGYVWVNGRQTWNGNAWIWAPGFWQPERTGYYWIQPEWEQRGDQYVYVDGQWAEPRTGYVYVDGYYDNRGSGYAWTPGRWEAERPNQVWVNGNWSTSGSSRTYNQGRWESRPNNGPIVRDHR